MNTTVNNLLSSDALRITLSGFRNVPLAVTLNGLAAALPLLRLEYSGLFDASQRQGALSPERRGRPGQMSLPH